MIQRRGNGYIYQVAVDNQRLSLSVLFLFFPIYSPPVRMIDSPLYVLYSYMEETLCSIITLVHLNIWCRSYIVEQEEPPIPANSSCNNNTNETQYKHVNMAKRAGASQAFRALADGAGKLTDMPGAEGVQQLNERLQRIGVAQ
jgi:hypothetical protein